MVKQWSKVGAVALGAFTFAAIPYLIAWDRLPDPLASHWGPTGQPDGSMPGWAGLLSTAALVVFAGLGLSILLARHVEGRRNPSPESLGLTSFVSALAVGLAWVTVYLNLDATSWEQAKRLSWWLVLVVVIVALVGGLAGYRVGRKNLPVPRAPITWAPVTELRPGEIVAWVGSASSPGQLLAIVPGIVALVLVPAPFQWIGIMLIVLGSLLSRVVIRVGADGLTVLLGGVLPVKSIPVEKIDVAAADHIDPSRWGGWGYRLIADASAVVIRAGDGIVVNLTNGRRFAVTVDDAATGAGLLNGLVARSRSS
jgi:hypothetical protein